METFAIVIVILLVVHAGFRADKRNLSELLKRFVNTVLVVATVTAVMFFSDARAEPVTQVGVRVLNTGAFPCDGIKRSWYNDTLAQATEDRYIHKVAQWIGVTGGVEADVIAGSSVQWGASTESLLVIQGVDLYNERGAGDSLVTRENFEPPVLWRHGSGIVVRTQCVPFSSVHPDPMQHVVLDVYYSVQ